MNYLLLIIVAIAGIIIGSYFSSYAKASADRSVGLIFGQAKKKQENKEKILEFFGSNPKITNDDVEKLCNVSNATAERYLDQLEKEGKLIQHGKIGTDVFYTLK
ncbi:winged helix-turn-helix domain-containing protein [Patescibacteria group bacterium]|nr:winged helix-turn-helix domain-containing protein [Patescibacteria group bacterium]MCG2694506.1 winged helix-turn-helix domain-containing protein [Candidatus Parcubacteria bacterium]